jgi:phosphoribosylformylglycinamidine synthase
LILKARIEIRLKAGILDPQGKAIGGALGGLGYKGLGEVRQGKLIEIDLPHATDKAAAEKEVAAMCKTLLANPVTEDFRVELTD